MDFSLLTEDQIWGNEALDVMKHCGTKVAPTDLTVLLGGYMRIGDPRIGDPASTCDTWSASSNADKTVSCVNYYGHKNWDKTDRRYIAVRPALLPSETSKIIPTEERTIDGIRVAEYGEYPQTVADESTSAKLERLLVSRSLRSTGKNYTFDSVGLDDCDTAFKATSFPEYEMDDKRYIHVTGRHTYGYSMLSTGKRVEIGKSYWVEVQPIEWLVDKSGIMVTRKCLFAGIQFDTKKEYDGDFSKTFMKHYLDTYFAKEMESAERVANREKSKNIENSDMTTSKISLLRAVVAPNVSKEKGVVNPKMSADEKKARLNSTFKALQSVKVKDITD